MMNRKTGMYAALVTLAAVAGFACAMAFDSKFGDYLTSMFIAWGFVPMIGAFVSYAGNDRKAPGYTAVAFASVYAVLVMLVYFAQLTTVRSGGLSAQAVRLLDYGSFGLMFCYDMLGYAFMALATFFIAFTIVPETTGDKWLKGLLLVHGIFAVSCIVIPMTGIFGGATAGEKDGGALFGTLILEFWCAYFIPVCLLSFIHFKKKKST
jgi:hypothetical protein